MASGSILEQLLVLIKVSRLPGWCFGPILYTIGVIHSRVFPKSVPSILRSGLQLFCLSFPLCIVVFGVNDVYDYASDLHNPRKQEQSLEGGILDPIYHPLILSAARISSAFILLSSFLTLSAHSSRDARAPSARDFQQSFITILILVLSWQYSAPPLRLKERPVWDSISNGGLVWLCWALGYTSSSDFFLFGSGEGEGESEGARKGWLLALCTTGVHALGAAADVEADVDAGQRTIATAFGERAAAGFSVVLYLLASTTVNRLSFVWLYTLVGTSISLIPVFRPDWTHEAFKAIVYVSILGAVGWIGERALGILKGRRSG